MDKHFVQLTLLLDQGEEIQGPRWQASKQFQNLHEVLDQVPDPAIVVLGPPGSGKSTLLRHYELDSAQAALETLDNGADTGGLPLTFFLPLNSYKPARSGDPLPLPKDWLAERWKVTGSKLSLLVDWSLNSAMNYLSGLLSYDYNRAGHPFEPGDESCAVGSLSSLR